MVEDCECPPPNYEYEPHPDCPVHGTPVPYELIEPLRPCLSPHGHALEELMLWGNPIPVRAFCARCGQRYTIITFEAP